MEEQEVIQNNQNQQPGKLAPKIPNPLKPDDRITFENDFGQNPVGLGHFTLDQGAIAILTLAGAFVGAALGGLPFAGVILLAGWNDVRFAGSDEKEGSISLPSRIEEVPVAPALPQEVEATAVEVPATPIEKLTPPDVVPNSEGIAVQNTRLTPVDIAHLMAKIPKSTIIAASPRVGKGVVVSMAIAHISQLHPDLEIWLIDPKDEPTERHYWSLIDPDKRCHFDLRDFDVDVEAAVEIFHEHLIRFNRSSSPRKLLIIDEFVTLNQKCAGTFMNQLKDFVVGICSSGEVSPDKGIGRFVWAITQSPYVSDLGFKTKAALATFQRVFLLNKASIHLYSLAVSASFVPAGFEQKLSRLLEQTGRIFYYSRTDSWHPIPSYELPNSLLKADTKPTTPSETQKWDRMILEATDEQINELIDRMRGNSSNSVQDGSYPETIDEQIAFAVEAIAEYFQEKNLEGDTARNIYNGKNRLKKVAKTMSDFKDLLELAAEMGKLSYLNDGNSTRISLIG